MILDDHEAQEIIEQNTLATKVHEVNLLELRGSIEGYIPLVAQYVRDYFTAQKELWQRIPELAVEADGKRGYWDRMRDIYTSGFLMHKGAFIDCATGELYETSATRRLASDEKVFPLATHLDDFDATQIVADFEKHAAEPQGTFAQGDPEAHRQYARRRYKVDPIYTTPINERIVR